jgi:Zn-dependent peptidase ImmA (M78 family)
MVTQAQINSIEAKANTVLEGVFGNVNNISLPVALDKVLGQYDFTVASGAFEDKDVSGAMERSDKIIYVADDEIPNRKAFTVAHELGHYFLHVNKQHDVFYRSQIINLTDEKQGEESEANWFAASLLMPESQLCHYFSVTRDIGELATIFGVSSTAVYYRLKNLGLLI